MAPVIVSLERLHEFSSAESFATWLGHHHASETEVWIKIHKVGSGLTSITAKEAIDEVLCWGWIDAIRKAFDDQSFLQRYTPRGKKSIWSQVNVDNVARLTSEGRMTEFGLKQVSAAKLDGRWQRAYGSGKYMLISAVKLRGADLERVRGVYDGLKKEELQKLSRDIQDLLKEKKDPTVFNNSTFTNNPN